MFPSYNFQFADHHLIEKIRILIDSVDESGCSACLRIKISQPENSCTTPILHDLTGDKTYSGSEIGDCGDLRIDINLPIDVTFQHETTDGFKGKFAILRTMPNSYQCPITEWLDSDDSNYENSFSTRCIAAGKYNKIK